MELRDVGGGEHAVGEPPAAARRSLGVVDAVSGEVHHVVPLERRQQRHAPDGRPREQRDLDARQLVEEVTEPLDLRGGVRQAVGRIGDQEDAQPVGRRRGLPRRGDRLRGDHLPRRPGPSSPGNRCRRGRAPRARGPAARRVAGTRRRPAPRAGSAAPARSGDGRRPGGRHVPAPRCDPRRGGRRPAPSRRRGRAGIRRRRASRCAESAYRYPPGRP